MTLLNAPVYDASREAAKRNVLIGSGIALLLGAVLALAGYFLGHGWFFVNLPAEYRVKTFMNTIQAGDYAKAYGIWENDAEWQQHPQKYDYTLQRFTEDWTTASDWGGPVTSFHVDVSKRDDSGVVVAVTINGKKRFFLKREKKDGNLDYSPREISY